MNNNYAHKETNFMHDIFSEKVNAIEMLFYLYLERTITVVPVRENRKGREKWITSKGQSPFPEISERKSAYYLNYHPEFPEISRL